jgi:hypothetical protein
MVTIHKVVATLSASHDHKKGCSCLQAWTKFSASSGYTNYIRKIEGEIDAEMQQGVFNDTGELGTSKKKISAKAPAGWEKTVKHMKAHKEITSPVALAHWRKDQGHTPHN